MEEAPVPDVARSGLRLLFVGINPGVMTARTRHHFGNPLNPFWKLLFEAGLTAQRLAPDQERALLDLGIGITNVVSRATPGSADVTREDIRRGRERLGKDLGRWEPDWIAFVGKQARAMALGPGVVPLGRQMEPLNGARVFVLPSTSPANAALTVAQKRHWFLELRREAFGDAGRA